MSCSNLAGDNEEGLVLRDLGRDGQTDEEITQGGHNCVRGQESDEMESR